MVEANFPRWLMVALSTRFSIQTFVETGTSEGWTAVLAANVFPTVHTIEVNPEFYGRAVRDCRDNPRITRHLGLSVEHIPKILPCLTGPTLWYLDGHWSGSGRKFGPECPVLEELALLRDRPQDVVVVDDARLFDAPPGPPHDPAQWPTMDRVVEAARAPGRHVARFLDSLIVSPAPLFCLYGEPR